MKRLIIISVLALMVLAGCQSEQQDSKMKPPVYYGGTQGLISTFEPMGMKEDNIQTVWEGKDFPVEVTVKNKGEQDIEEGDLTVKIHGVDTEMFGIDPDTKQNTKLLEGVSEYNKQGGRETIEFPDASLDPVSGLTHEANFFATIEYNYKTHVAIPNVCFKKNYQDERVCELEGSKNVYASGAPITVKKVEQEPSGSNRISLKIYVENAGGGDVTLPGQDFSYMHDKLKFEMTEGNENIEFECTSSGDESQARLNEGKATIRCRSGEIQKEEPYTKQVTLELSYKYKDIIQQNVVVRSNPQE